jgi:dCMP deaminase
MKQKFINLYMDWAIRTAQLSHARRLKVGAVIVKDDSVVSYGYNGMPAGWDNNCEDEIPISPWTPELPKELNATYTLKTKPEVLHAERNALDKLTKRGGSGGNGAAMFATHAPCLECAKSIYGAGIKQLWYNIPYRDESGINFLTKSGVEVNKV